MLLQRTWSLFNPQVWLQAAARGIVQAGHGMAQFYTPIIFVDRLGFSATAIGLGLSVGSLAGLLGHWIGGSLADSPRFGRKGTLLLSGGLAGLGVIVLGLSESLGWFAIANVLLGLGTSLYWPTADAAVTDVTDLEQRHHAFGVLNIANSVGLGVGIAAGSAVLAAGYERSLFGVAGVGYLLFVALVLTRGVETVPDNLQGGKTVKGWGAALRDMKLWLFVGVNVLFTTYFALMNSSLPLYFNNFLFVDRDAAASPVAALFIGKLVGSALLQLPLVRLLSPLSRSMALAVALLLWGVGFGVVALSTSANPWTGAIVSLAIIAAANAAYSPFAASLVAELAPVSLRGTYAAMSSQCWSIGFFIGPLLGGWTIDRTPEVARLVWLAIAASTLVGVGLLFLLRRSRRLSSPAVDEALVLEPSQS